MNYKEARPAAWLTSFIKCFWELEYDRTTGSTKAEPVLPDGCPEIVFNLSDRFLRLCSEKQELQPVTIFAGQMSRSILIRPTGDVRLFGVRFQPAGAFPLVSFPLSEITDHIVDFADACGRTGRDIESKMNEARSFAERVKIFEGFFLNELASRTHGDSIATRASDLIVAGRGSHPISTIAEEAGISERRLERRFKQFIGISPKMFSRIVRFQNVVNAVQASHTRGLLDAALSFGYYDQSHLIRDFNEFSGVSPLAFFDRKHQISDVFTGAV